MLKKLCYAILFLLPYSLCAQGQQALIVEVYGQEEGLQQLNTETLSQDNLGYVWAGTEDGLYRFNGYGFTSFLHKANDPKTIKDDHIRGLLAVGDTLWIASNSMGILGYQLSKNRFFSLIENPGDEALKIAYNIFQLNDGFLLFAVKGHGILYDRKTKEKIVLTLPEGRKKNTITSVVSHCNGKFWLGTSALGLLRFQLKNKAISPVSDFTPKKVNCLLQQNDQIFIGTPEGLFVFDGNTFTPLPFGHSVRAMHLMDKDILYIATLEGFYSYDTNLKETREVSLIDKHGNPLNNTLIEDFLADEKGNLWLGTAGQGLLYHNSFREKFTTKKIQVSKKDLDQTTNLFPIFKQNDTTLWLGTQQGAFRHNPKTGQYVHYPMSKSGFTYAFAEDEEGTLWAGTIFNGLLKYRPATESFERFTVKNGLPDNEVSNLIPMGKHQLWVTTWAGGITAFDTETETFTPLLFGGKQLDRARVHLKDSKGFLWLGTDEGLFKTNSKREILRHYTQDDAESPISNNRIFALKEDQNGNIWVGTASGLTKLNTKTGETTLYYKQQGFPNDFVYTILIDPKDHIWASTNYGLSVFNPMENSFKNYTEADGLQDNEFNGKSGFKDSDGLFYFGGNKGYNVFDPAELIDNPFLPEVQIEAVELFNKPISRNEMFTDTLFFKSKEDVLTFHFAALNYLNPKKCSYQYKLKGFDQNWSPPTKKRSVTYTNLNPDTYQLQIKASNDNGKWNPAAKKLTLVVIPPWHQTTWAKIGFAALLILTIVLFYYYKTSHLKQEKAKLEQLVLVRTKDLRKKNTDLKASNETTRKQRDNIEFLMKELSHRVKNNLQIISSLLNIQGNTIADKKSKDILSLAKNKILTIAYVQETLTDTQSETVDVGRFVHTLSSKIIQLLSDEHKPKFNTQFNIEENIIVNIDITLLGLILNELITNTHKYAFSDFDEKNLLTIEIRKKDFLLHLTIKDNGFGYNPDDIHSNSLGLEMISEMTRQLNGSLEVTTKNGTANTIIIPLDK